MAVELDKPRSLTEITTSFGKHHAEKKTATSQLEKEKKEFYEAATKDLEAGTLARRVIEIPEGSDPEKYVSTNHPGWRIVEGSIEDSSVQIEEDPELKKFVHVNHEDGKVYWRNAIEGTPLLDDERLKEENPELWIRISAPRGHDVITEFAQWAGGDIVGQLAQKFLREDPFGTRELINPDELSEDDHQEMMDYIVPGPISLKMEAPRKAKPEELEDTGE